jgi:hypothetical protein
MPHTNENTTNGNNNIVIQEVTDSTITLNVDGNLQEIHNDLIALKTWLQNNSAQTFQVADKLYNIGSINQANFYTVLQPAHTLPRELSTYLPHTDPNKIVGRQTDIANLHALLSTKKEVVLVTAIGGSRQNHPLASLRTPILRPL